MLGMFAFFFQKQGIILKYKRMLLLFSSVFNWDGCASTPLPTTQLGTEH